MIRDPSICDQTYALFLIEAPELLQTIEQDLLCLKEDYSLNKVHNLMRMTHTLKAAAAGVGLETLKTVAHSLEDIFKTLYNPNVVIDSESEVLLFQAYECLRLPLIAEFTNAPVNESEVLNRAAAIFAQLQERLEDSSCFEAQLPTSSDLGFDITKSIFETDVRKRLATLAATLVQPADEVAMILRSSATVFLGLAEALDLPGWGTIAQTAIAALDAHPDQAVSIAQVALADFQREHALVLAGDRPPAGERIEPEIDELADPFLLEQIFGEAAMEVDQKLVSGSTSKQAITLAQTIRVDLERLERLNHLTGDLLTNQNQQHSANEQLQETVQKLQEQVRSQQQRLSRIISDWSNRQQLTAGQDLNSWSRLDSLAEMNPDKLYVLLQSALKETVQLAEKTGEVALFNQQHSQTLEKQQRLLTDIRNDLMGARMSPLGDIFSRLPPVLQQLVVMHGKPAELQLSGTQILVDKTIAQMLYDPLLHLVRNAFDHGIEPPKVRRQLGKPEIGQICIHAYQQDRWTVIEVSDDGKGLDFQKFRARAIEMNWLTPAEASHSSEEKLLDLLFKPGFSTASQVSELSGRGVGLDVVRSQLQVLQGSITVQSEPQQGTTFVLQIPHVLTIAKLDLPVALVPQAPPSEQDTNQFGDRVAAPRLGNQISIFPNKSALLIGLVIGVVSGLVLMVVSYYSLQLPAPAPKVQNPQST